MARHFEVVISSEGRGGWVTYKEEAKQLTLPWELIQKGISVSIPHSKEWNKFCELNNANWAKERREEILKNIAQEAVKNYWRGTYEITDIWINIYHGPSIFSVFKNLFSQRNTPF